jgi:hypothetical protein
MGVHIVPPLSDPPHLRGFSFRGRYEPATGAHIRPLAMLQIIAWNGPEKRILR